MKLFQLFILFSSCIVIPFISHSKNVNIIFVSLILYLKNDNYIFVQHRCNVSSFNVIAFNWKENKKTISVVVVQVYGMSFICAFGSLLTAFIPSKSTNKRHFHVLRSFLHKEC